KRDWSSDVCSSDLAAHILATNIGVTLRQIVLAQPDPELSEAVREGTIAAITGTAARPAAPLAAAVEIAASSPESLGPTETKLLIEWLTELDARHHAKSSARCTIVRLLQGFPRRGGRVP